MENTIDKLKSVTFEVIDTNLPEGEEIMILTSCVYNAETKELNGWNNKKPVSLSEITLEEWENKACID
jgi:hypothetical protein|tara:strand:+ start:938 stop:1141 length:204 start_codon:yes stop_codon:yes gene_type:complete